MEIWKDILGYEGYYQASNLGNIKSLDRVFIQKNGIQTTKRGKILSPKNDRGYLRVGLVKNKKRTMLGVHRLVALAFIKNPFNKEQVHHIDKDKSNNLMWVSCTENNNLGTKLIRSSIKQGTPVKRVNKQTGSEKYYNSLSEAGRDGFSRTSVTNACRRNNNLYNGFLWYFTNKRGDII